MSPRSSLCGALLALVVAGSSVGCAAPVEDVGEDGAAALSERGTRALGALSKLVNGDETALAEYGPPATLSTKSVGSWSVLTHLGEGGRIEGYLLVSESKRVAFVVDLADDQLDDGLLAEVAGVQMTGGDEDLAATQRALLEELDAAFSREIQAPESEARTLSLAFGLAPASFGTMVASLFRAISKAPVKNAVIDVKAAAATVTSEGQEAAKLVGGAAQGKRPAVAASAKVKTASWPNLFEAGGPLRRALGRDAFVLGDDVLKVARAKPPAQTIALDIAPSGVPIPVGGVSPDGQRIATRIQSYLADLGAKQKAQGKIVTPTEPKDLNVLDISPITPEPVEVGRTFAQRTGATHVFFESESELARRTTQIIAEDRVSLPFKERAGGYFYYLGRMASDRIAAVEDGLRAGNLWGPGRYASSSPGNLVADHASIFFMRPDLRTFASPDLLVDRVVRLVSAGKRVVIVDGGEAAGNGTLGVILRHPRFRALSEADRALVDAI